MWKEEGWCDWVARADRSFPRFTVRASCVPGWQIGWLANALPCWGSASAKAVTSTGRTDRVPRQERGWAAAACALRLCGWMEVPDSGEARSNFPSLASFLCALYKSLSHNDFVVPCSPAWDSSVLRSRAGFLTGRRADSRARPVVGSCCGYVLRPAPFERSPRSSLCSGSPLPGLRGRQEQRSSAETQPHHWRSGYVWVPAARGSCLQHHAAGPAGPGRGWRAAERVCVRSHPPPPAAAIAVPAVTGWRV